MTGDSLVTHFLNGNRIYLREVRLADVNDAYYRWMNDPEATAFLESRFFPNSLESLREYVAARQQDRDNVFLAIIAKDQERHIGNIKLGPIQWIHRNADIGILIGEKDCWGKGYAREAIQLVSAFAFQALNLHKLTAGAYESNVGSIKAFERAGFVIEGVLKEQVFSKGRYENIVLMGLVKGNERT